MNHLRITTAELAKICNVSQGTVDRALHNRTGISETTRQKVIETAVLYGYRKEYEEKNNLKIIGLIIFNLKNEFFTKIIADIEHELKDYGYMLAVMLTNYDKQTEIEAIRKFYNAGVDGIILCSVNSGEEFEKYLNSFNIPIVAIGNKISSIPYVGIDDYKAMNEHTEAVINKGYKEIIYFSPAIVYNDAYAQKKRFEGFISAVKSFKNYSVVTSIDDIKESYAGETAVICSTDYYALEIYSKVKGCIIYGFDGIDIIKKLKMPISSVSYSTEKIAKNVVNAVINKSKENIIIEHCIENETNTAK